MRFPLRLIFFLVVVVMTGLVGEQSIGRPHGFEALDRQVSWSILAKVRIEDGRGVDVGERRTTLTHSFSAREVLLENLIAPANLFTVESGLQQV